MHEENFNKLSEKEKSQFNQSTKDLLIETFVLKEFFHCFTGQLKYKLKRLKHNDSNFRLIDLIDFLKENNQFQYVSYMIDKFVFTEKNRDIFYQEDLINYTSEEFLNILGSWNIALKEDMKYIKNQNRAIKTIETKVRKILNNIYWNYEDVNL